MIIINISIFYPGCLNEKNLPEITGSDNLGE